MNAIEVLPFILFIVVIVTSIAEQINVPYPLLLVVAGLVVGFMPGIPNWHPANEIILPLFLPPILFAAARTITWRDIKSYSGTIGSLSIVLVLITTVSIALLLDYLVPNLSFSTALVLGAIISPTDTVAATAIMSKLNVKQHIIRTIEIESLFNDATSIVLYKAAVLFVVLGTISASDITYRTFLVGLGGILVGLVFSYLTRLITSQFLTRSENELPIIMSLILAYVAYLFADRMGVSGVLAVVTAGLYHKKTERAIEARTRLSETSVWKTLIFFLNGIIFITIGMQFPSYLNKVRYLPLHELVLFSVFTIVGLLLLRLVWISFTAYLPIIWHRIRRKHSKPFDWKEVLIISWSGMRGLVSLALAIAIPTILLNNQPFPNRDVIIFLTIVAILFTLLVQGLTLPWLINKLKIGKEEEIELKLTSGIYQRLTKDTIKNLKTLEDSDFPYFQEAKKLVENYYKNRLMVFNAEYDSDLSSQEVGKYAETLLAKMLQKERDKLTKMRLKGDITEDIYIRITQKLDRDEVGFASYR